MVLIMKKALFLVIALICGFTAYGQTPFDSDLKFKVEDLKEGRFVVETDISTGIVSKSNKNDDPLYYKVIDTKRMLAEVTGSVRAANLKGKVVIPPSVVIKGKTYKVVNIGEGAFKGCTKITSVEIQGNTLQKLCHRCFEGCTGLTSLSLNSNCQNLKNDAFVKCSNLKTLRASSRANNFDFIECNVKVVKF